MRIAWTYCSLAWLCTFLGYQSFCTGSNNIPIQLNDDVLGLIVFKTGIEDPSSALASWTEDDENPCSWKHVECSPVSGRVTRLTLDELGLSGKIVRGLERLEKLQVLSLSGNNFSGGISEGLTLLPSLKRLNISRNGFSGVVPDRFANISSSLQFLDLSENLLSGPLPPQMFDTCSSLRFLSLAHNKFDGPIPAKLANCVFLGGLNLSHNQFSGDPDFSNLIWPLKRLRVLDLSHNQLSGVVPPGLASVHTIKELLLQKNQLRGPLPGDIGLCPHLVRVDLSSNLFTGGLPESLQNLASLKFIKLSDNLLMGDFPLWIGKLTSLHYLDFSNNEFTGVLPASIGELTSLNHLNLSQNSLSGEIPKELTNCNMLSEIRLRANCFNGSIPQGLFNLGLEKIDMSSNGLSGSIPPGSEKLFESLSLLDLSNNQLTGVIPPEMGLCFNLRYLNLSGNYMRSRFPPELGFFRNLSILDLRNSSIYGSIPQDLCDSNSLAVLQLDGNSLTGSIPQEIGNCSDLYLLGLSHNSLSGSIPVAMSALKKLKIIKLEFNNLSGEIPKQMGSLGNLLALNVSYNRLTGRLPTGGVFPTLDRSSLQGNLGLCSPLLIGPCKMNVPKPLVLNPDAFNQGTNGNTAAEPGPIRPRHKQFLSISAIVAIAAATLIFIGVAVVSLLNASARRKIAFVDNAIESMCSSSSRSGSPSRGRLVLFNPSSELRYEDWMVSADLVLNKASEIGRGVFGTLYKAYIREGKIVAIKKLITSNIIQYREDFDREVRVLGKAKHPNLMTLRGYYWTPQMQLLISDYATNGSLHARLHERSSSTPPLVWANRFEIALGTAKGLAHLHQSFRPPIIHYNIKPSNILLDENYNPKISDFGLARLLPKLDKHVLSSRFQTALGYVAPELACQSLRINEKCDIYGFGVMILELVTGRKPVEYGDDDVFVLTDYVRVLLEQGNVVDCVDASMGEYPEEEVLPVLKLGLVCTSQIPSSRPSMPEIVQILQVIKTPIRERMEAF